MTTTRVEKTIQDYDEERKVQVQRYLPQGWDHAPTTVVEALQCARDVLVEEGQDIEHFNEAQKQQGRWGIGHWFSNSHPQQDPEDPFCNSWSVCAEGAVGIVTCGVYRKLERDWFGADPTSFVWSDWFFGNEEAEELISDDQASGYTAMYGAEQRRLYVKANEFLTQAANDIWGTVADPDDPWDDGIHYSAPNEANDNEDVCHTRTEVVEWFNTAINLAEAASEGTNP